MKIEKIIDSLEALIPDPSKGLPEDVFLFASRIVPLINVDLLIKNEMKQTLLTWRDDGYHPAGWHIPGGVIRYKETFSDRLMAVAQSELGAQVRFQEKLLAINQLILPKLKNRVHSISLLYECFLMTPPSEKLKYTHGIPLKGQWAWHSSCPDDLHEAQEMYRQYF